MPPVDQLLTSLSADAPSITLLVNQSAVSGLPAALNQVTSALLRLMVAAGGAKSSPAPAAPTSSAGTTPARQLEPTGTQQGRLRVQRTHAALKVQDAAVGGLSGVLGGSRGAQGRAGGTSSHGGAGGGGHLPSCMPVISTVSSPLPLMVGEEAQRVRQDAGALMLVLCMTLAASVLSASFVVFLVRWVGGWRCAPTGPARGVMCVVPWEQGAVVCVVCCGWQHAVLLRHSWPVCGGVSLHITGNWRMFWVCCVPLYKPPWFVPNSCYNVKQAVISA